MHNQEKARCNLKKAKAEIRPAGRRARATRPPFSRKRSSRARPRTSSAWRSTRPGRATSRRSALASNGVFPGLGDRATVFDLPPINGAADALAALTSIVAGVRAGEITAAEGCELSKLVDHYVRALEAKDFEPRLDLLESESPKGA